jgi:hypothetical protein
MVPENGKLSSLLLTDQLQFAETVTLFGYLGCFSPEEHSFSFLKNLKPHEIKVEHKEKTTTVTSDGAHISRTIQSNDKFIKNSRAVQTIIFITYYQGRLLQLSAQDIPSRPQPVRPAH